MKLNASQMSVLTLAASRYEISYFDAARGTAFANGRTLSALVERALLEKIEYPDGSKNWRITDLGRKAVTEAA
jgi:hypothetical protein